MEIFSIISLALAGLLLTFVGLSRLSNPVKTYAKSSGINLPNDPSLLNEMRGVAAVMLCGGIIALLGTFVPSLRITAHVVAVLIFIGFAAGRLISISADGKPGKQIVQGIGFELVLGTLNLISLFIAWV